MYRPGGTFCDANDVPDLSEEIGIIDTQAEGREEIVQLSVRFACFIDLGNVIINRNLC